MIPPLWRRPLIALAVLAVLAALLCAALAAPAAAQNGLSRTTDHLVVDNKFRGLLGSLEIRIERGSHPFGWQWYGVLDWIGIQNWLAPPAAPWRRLLATLERPRDRAQLAALNRAINAAIRYRSDAEAHGAADFWATPAEALARGGDCEDVAIAKYAALRALGLPDAALRFVIVADRDALHAVLAVRLAGTTWILDNRAEAVVAARYRLRYRPLWSANGAGEWTHIVTPAIRARFVDRFTGGLS